MVIVIITVLAGASGALFHPPVSKAAESAARLATCLEFVRAQPIATNLNGALRFDELQATTGFRVTSDELLPLIHLGVQPTIVGRVVAAVEREVAVVQVQCASGAARMIQP